MPFIKERTHHYLPNHPQTIDCVYMHSGGGHRGEGGDDRGPLQGPKGRARGHARRLLSHLLGASRPVNSCVNFKSE